MPRATLHDGPLSALQPTALHRCYPLRKDFWAAPVGHQPPLATGRILVGRRVERALTRITKICTSEMPRAR